MAKWVVVADSVRCRLYEQALVNSDYREVRDLVHPEARLRDRDAVTDKPGSNDGAVGQGRHPMPPKTDIKDHEQELFAREICSHLEKGRQNGEFNHLVLVAPPAFLGKLRNGLSAELGKLVVAEINKDLTRQSASEVQAYIKQAS